MTGAASPVEAAQLFATALAEIRHHLFADLNPVSNVADLLAAVRSRRKLPRKGVTTSGIQYTVHGAGCRMIDQDGREVDVDLVTDPVLGYAVEAFDVWRIRWFLDEATRARYSKDDITGACAQLVEQGRLREVVDGRWFALVDLPDNLY